MKHEIKKLENSAVEIKISLTAEEVSPIKNEVLGELASKAEVPGFRKGKAPLDKVEAQFKDALKEEDVYKRQALNLSSTSSQTCFPTTMFPPT